MLAGLQQTTQCYISEDRTLDTAVLTIYCLVPFITEYEIKILIKFVAKTENDSYLKDNHFTLIKLY